MKTVIALIVLAFFIAQPVWAQPSSLSNSADNRGDSDHWQRGGGMGHGPFGQLNLTDEQKTKLREMRSEMQGERDQLREKRQAQIDAILTPEQREKIKQFREQRMNNRHGQCDGNCNEVGDGEMRGERRGGMNGGMERRHRGN